MQKLLGLGRNVVRCGRDAEHSHNHFSSKPIGITGLPFSLIFCISNDTYFRWLIVKFLYSNFNFEFQYITLERPYTKQLACVHNWLLSRPGSQWFQSHWVIPLPHKFWKELLLTGFTTGQSGQVNGPRMDKWPKWYSPTVWTWPKTGSFASAMLPSPSLHLAKVPELNGWAHPSNSSQMCTPVAAWCLRWCER